MSRASQPSAPEPLPVVKGTVDLLVSRALLGQPRHGFEVTAWIEEGSRGRLAFDDSAVYQALYRLEKRGLVEADWGVTENNRRARYYQLTPQGRVHLREETERLVRYSQIVTGMLTGAPAAQPA